MKIVVPCFVYTILTQLVFFFFSCYAEIFIVNEGLIISPSIYSINSPLEVISLMEIVVLFVFSLSILTQLAFFSSFVVMPN